MKQYFGYMYILFLISTGTLRSQNVLRIDSTSAGPNQTVAYSVKVSNSEKFTALQLDVELPSELDYVANSAKLTSRASTNHQLAASIVGVKTLRIISYSVSADTFKNRDGAVVTFQCTSKSNPGTYTLNVINPIIGNVSQQNILTSSINGQFILLAPKLIVNNSDFDFGSVALKQSIEHNIQISNEGNVQLTISKISSDSREIYFTDSSSVILQPNQSINRTIRFTPLRKGSKTVLMKIFNDDSKSAVKNITAKAVAYAVNEIHILNEDGRSGYKINIPIYINNMEAFTGFQFDLVLPQVLLHTPGDVTLTQRKTNHKISSNIISTNRVRVVAFSQTNSFFQNDTGVVANIGFDLDGIGGNYPIQIDNVTLSNENAENILSQAYNGNVNIESPDIDAATDISMGETSIRDTLSRDIFINNNGNDTLIITSAAFDDKSFWLSSELVQLISPGNKESLTVKFHNDVKGKYNSKLTVRNNDPDEDPLYIKYSASSFNPNYMIIPSVEARVGDTVTVNLDIHNYDPFVAFQCDIDFPGNLQFVDNGVSLTNRKEDHSIGSALLSSTKIRLFAYSLTQKYFKDTTGTVAQLKFLVGDKTGSFPLVLSNAIISNILSENIIKNWYNGVISISSRQIKKTINLAKGWNMVSVPVEASDMQSTTLFGGKNSSVFGFENGYVIKDLLSTGFGYWVRYPDTKTISFFGSQSDKTTIPVKLGWNMIGGYDRSITTSGLTTTPPNIIDSQIFGFTNGYTVMPTIEPGYGYWVRVNNDGEINTNNSLSKASGGVKLVGNQINDKEKKRITITDKTNKSVTLYVSASNENLNQYDLPPAPPSGIPDVRWETNRTVEVLSGEGRDILLSGMSYPLELSVSGMNMLLKDKSGSIEKVIRDGENVTIGSLEVERLTASTVEIPRSYELYQNYPNPFNPTTKIKFGLPDKVKVKLEVYNVLGQRVAVLLDKELDAGYHEVEWKAMQYASGMYIYRISAGSFTNVKKLMLMK